MGRDAYCHLMYGIHITEEEVGDLDYAIIENLDKKYPDVEIRAIVVNDDADAGIIVCLYYEHFYDIDVYRKSIDLDRMVQLQKQVEIDDKPLEQLQEICQALSVHPRDPVWKVIPQYG